MGKNGSVKREKAPYTALGMIMICNKTASDTNSAEETMMQDHVFLISHHRVGHAILQTIRFRILKGVSEVSALEK